MPTKDKFLPIKIEVYPKTIRFAVVYGPAINVFYGTREQLEKFELLQHGRATGHIADVIEMGPKVAVDLRSGKLETGSDSIYLSTSDQSTVCTHFIMPSAQALTDYGSSLLFIENRVGPNNCLLKQILYKIGFRNLAKDIYIERKFAEDDLSKEIEHLFGKEPLSGMDYTAFRDWKRRQLN